MVIRDYDQRDKLEHKRLQIFVRSRTSELGNVATNASWPTGHKFLLTLMIYTEVSLTFTLSIRMEAVG